jgi:hypothetical protein
MRSTVGSTFPQSNLGRRTVGKRCVCAARRVLGSCALKEHEENGGHRVANHVSARSWRGWPAGCGTWRGFIRRRRKARRFRGVSKHQRWALPAGGVTDVCDGISKRRGRRLDLGYYACGSCFRSRAATIARTKYQSSTSARSTTCTCTHAHASILLEHELRMKLLRQEAVRRAHRATNAAICRAFRFRQYLTTSAPRRRRYRGSPTRPCSAPTT